jgi:hypothetical protein
LPASCNVELCRGLVLQLRRAHRVAIQNNPGSTFHLCFAQFNEALRLTSISFFNLSINRPGEPAAAVVHKPCGISRPVTLARTLARAGEFPKEDFSWQYWIS